MPYPVILIPQASDETLVEVEFSFSGASLCPPRPPLSTQSSFSAASSCTSHSSKRSYRPTLTPGDFLVHAYGSAAVHDTLLDLRQLSFTSGETSNATPPKTPSVTEKDLEDEVEPATGDAQRKPRCRKKKKLLRYKYPKPPPKGTFCSAVARPQNEDADPLPPLPPVLIPQNMTTLKMKNSPSSTKIATASKRLELAVAKKLDEVAEERRQEEKALRSFELSERRRECGVPVPPHEGDLDMSAREPFMSLAEWRVKAEERLELRKLRRVKFALKGTDFNLKSSLPTPLPLDIDCRPNTSSFGLLEPDQFEVPRITRKRERTVSAGPGVCTRGSGGINQNAELKNRAQNFVDETRLGRPKSLTDINKLATSCATLQINTKLGNSG